MSDAITIESNEDIRTGKNLNSNDIRNDWRLLIVVHVIKCPRTLSVVRYKYICRVASYNWVNESDSYGKTLEKLIIYVMQKMRIWHLSGERILLFMMYT